ncbi:hypothetical protein GHT06_009954 [Daphnia sinensis]|uniref:CCHC-type domain-containing protein n=1 Tax=Daphnia sinensis TaxID=1820382 RepID=A0AAD5KY04_9CRUS|nr:hypothetical protein GHT06_009954 [Daphnia sinensis]
MSLYTGAKPKILSKPIKNTVRHGSQPLLPTSENLTSVPVSKINPELSEPSTRQKRPTRSTVSFKTAKLLQLGLNSKTIRKPKSFKWQDIKKSISNSPSLLARTIEWLRQSPSTSDFESESEKPPRALLQGSSTQLPSSLPTPETPPSPTSADFNFDSTLSSSLNEHQGVDSTDIREARTVIKQPSQLPARVPITCRTFTTSPICTQASLTIQPNFTGSRTKLSDSTVKINQQLFSTIKPETVETIAQPVALARRNSLPTETAVRPITPLAAVVCNNNKTLDADSSKESIQQEETASSSSQHSLSPILGPGGKTLHNSLNNIHQRLSSTPIPITTPDQPCSSSRPNPPTSFKSPLTPGTPSGSPGSNTKHSTNHCTAAQSTHHTRRPAHFNANVIIQQRGTNKSSCESISPILTAQKTYTQPTSGGEKPKHTTDKRDSQQIQHNVTYTTTRGFNATSTKTKQPTPPVAQSSPAEEKQQFHTKQTIKMDPLQYSLVTNVIPIRDLQELQKGQRAQTMLIQLQNFTGGPSTRFDRWIKLFENVVAMSNWNEKEKMNMLVTKMAGPAHDILQNILESVTQDYKEVKRLLQERFHGNENQDFFQNQLEEVKRHPGEAILDYGFRLKNIFEHGYPKGEEETKTDETTRLQMLRQKFLQGLDKTLRNKVRYKPFTTYEALVAETNKYALRLDGEKEEKDKREFINAVESNSTNIEILKAIEKIPETINALATGSRYPQKVPEKDGNPQRLASAEQVDRLEKAVTRLIENSDRNTNRFSNNSNFRQANSYQTSNGYNQYKQNFNIPQNYNTPPPQFVSNSPSRYQINNPPPRPFFTTQYPPRSDMTTCHSCGMKGHVKRDCRKRQEQNTDIRQPIKCYSCQQIGHRANGCMNRQMQQKPNIPGPSHGQGNA